MKISLIEAIPGKRRREALELLASTVTHGCGEPIILNGDFDGGGPWSGVSDLFRLIVPSLRHRRPDLFERHNLELIHALPEIRHECESRFPTLTDTAPMTEKVRNYPADRALRLVHGLIDLLDSWHYETERRGWVLVIDAFDRIGCIGSRFFVELVRRRAEIMNIHLVLGIAPDSRERVSALWPLGTEVHTSRLELDAEVGPTEDRATAYQEALELEEKVGENPIEAQVQLPRLISLWKKAGFEHKAQEWRRVGLEIYNTLGLYEDALRYGAGALEEAISSRPANKELHWSIFVKTFMSLAGLGRAEEAQQLSAWFLPEVSALAHRGRLSYLIAMLHGRFLPKRDLQRAEELLDEGLRLLEAADLPESELKFQAVFNRNGLAMIRTFQRRFGEALALCKWGRETLDAHLPLDSHRLHRSVLLYNMAQVYAMAGDLEQALEQFSRAMHEDPNYSEYYNERGSVLLRMGRVEEALADYFRAIELTPPYFEVFVNLGSCYRIMERWPDAEAAFSRALDLEPKCVAALVGLAEVAETQGKLDHAADAYTAALSLVPDRWDLLASRAVVNFQRELVAASIADLDRAIERAPSNADLFQNRGIALSYLGQADAARGDFEKYLSLAPEAEDAAAVRLKIEQLLPSAAGAP